MTFIKYLFTKAFLKQLAMAVGVIILLMMIVLWWLRMTTNHNQQIEVPDLAKLSLDAVEEKLDEVDLRFVILDSANYNPDYPKYSVIEQLPKAGKFVKEDRKIYLTLNPKGYKKLKIPEVVGRTRRQAEPTLLAMGFKIGKVTYRRYIAKDEVLQLRHKGKKLEKGAMLQKTSVIDLVLGDGDGGLNQGASEGDNNSSETEKKTEDGGE
ncbi:MAG: PASTA domain-containing protein [Flavobacteriaceae bacterium]|nr:PASTA domain-containing protein [Flavobacteriaceae bacterium]